MSLIRFFFARVRVVAVAAVIAVVAVLVSPVAASAVVTPGSGDPAGGTAVTISGIHFVQVSSSADANHTLGLTSEGSVYAWGANGDGQLGNGSNTNSSIPVQVLGVGGTGVLAGITTIAAGRYHSVAVGNGGSVYAWGTNGYGQLGNGSTSNSSTPVQVLGVGGSGVLSGITRITAGQYHSVAVGNGGSVYAWGANGYGQLGNGSTSNSSTPVLSANFEPVSVTFGGVVATNLVATGFNWSVTTPAGSAGSAAVLATANIFGGITAATPATATWNAGTFTYAAGIPPATSSPASSPAGTLAATGASTALLPAGIAVFAIGLSLLALAAFRRRKA